MKKRGFDDISGKRFGLLTVVKRAIGNPTNLKHRGVYWECLCDCGTTYFTYAYNLKKRKLANCGCTRKFVLATRLGKPANNRRKFGEARAYRVYMGYARNANLRKLVFELTFEDFLLLAAKDCHYCGLVPSNVCTISKPHYGDFIYSGIDRVDNKEGYTMNNCVPCCKPCNVAKMDRTLQDFISWIERIYRRTIMEKYAVQENKEIIQEKKASTNSCIECGTQLNSNSNVRHCKNCGTKPYESKIEK